jgi:hypothetical protein
MYCAITPPNPPAKNLEYGLIFLGFSWPSRWAKTLFAASKEPNLIADSGATLRTFKPLPKIDQLPNQTHCKVKLTGKEISPTPCLQQIFVRKDNWLAKLPSGVGDVALLYSVERVVNWACMCDKVHFQAIQRRGTRSTYDSSTSSD